MWGSLICGVLVPGVIGVVMGVLEWCTYPRALMCAIFAVRNLS